MSRSPSHLPKPETKNKQTQKHKKTNPQLTMRPAVHIGETRLHQPHCGLFQWGWRKAEWNCGLECHCTEQVVNHRLPQCPISRTDNFVWSGRMVVGHSAQCADVFFFSVQCADVLNHLWVCVVFFLAWCVQQLMSETLTETGKIPS